MTDPDHSKPTDELVQRYHDASAEDTRRPASKVREAVRAHALLVTASKAGTTEAKQAPAANQSRWKVSLLASVALAGLTGLLVLQFDRGTPEEQEAAYGRSSPRAASPVAASPSTPQAKSARSAPEAKGGPAATQANASLAREARVKPEPENRSPSPATAAPPPEAIQTVPAAPSGAAESGNVPVTVSRSAPQAPAAAPARAMPPPAAVARAPAMMQKSDGMASPASRAETTTGNSTQDLTAALHEAARTGRISQLERLLQQGAPINAADSSGRTALILAVIHGHTATVQRLLALGANKALADKEGLNALQHARRLGLDRMASLIEAGS